MPANLGDPDDVYERLARLHEGLSETESLKVRAKLALTLANHVGDPRGDRAGDPGGAPRRGGLSRQRRPPTSSMWTRRSAGSSKTRMAPD